MCWVAANADDLGFDAARIAISGESAGGGHAAALSLHARDRRRAGEDAPSICLQLLDSPMLDDRTASSADPHPWTGRFTWTRDHNAFGWSSLLGQEAGSAKIPEAAVPARVQDLSDLPPACITIGGLDLFLEESLEYARRLSRAGVPVELHVIPGGYHGFGLAAGTPQVQQKNALEVAALQRALGIGPR
nr:alpha/beta hydrolase fold domain-containing protein [Novosphingobium aquimarinum]